MNNFVFYIFSYEMNRYFKHLICATRMHHLDLEHTYTRVYYIARNNVWYFLSYLRPPLSHDASRQSSRSKSFLFFMISFFFFSFIHSLLSPIELMKIILCPSLHNLLVHRHFLVVQCNYILFFFFSPLRN